MFVLADIYFCSLILLVADGRPANLYKDIEPTAEEKLLEEDKEFWFKLGGDYLEKMLKLEQEPKKHVAKNVVIMIGDGMGIPTVTATRIYRGQRNFGKSGEDHNLVYDLFPNVGLVKTYNVDMQVPDSAGTATALLSGVKTRYKAIGVDVGVNRNESNRKTFKKSKLENIMHWAQNANKATGIITTTRITHATPASAYAHVHSRDWECDSKVPNNYKKFVKDIARQLVENAPGKNLNVILGGGYQQLGHIPTKLANNKCTRKDGRNLTNHWIKNHENAAFVTTKEQLANVGDVDYLLGLFHKDALPYQLLRDETSTGVPSLSEMTSEGLKVLNRSKNGFVLMIEGALIDQAHHDNYARLALGESAEFENAVATVVENTDSDTLIIVTADHSHTMTINGYPKRGNDILGFGIENVWSKPGLTLSYANGPGFDYHYTPQIVSVLFPWLDVRTDPKRFNTPQYQHLATIKLPGETHAGEDVSIYAKGPCAHLIRGVMEQNYVAHLISHAACIGPRAKTNPHCTESAARFQNLMNSAEFRPLTTVLYIVLSIMMIIFMCLP